MSNLLLSLALLISPAFPKAGADSNAGMVQIEAGTFTAFDSANRSRLTPPSGNVIPATQVASQVASFQLDKFSVTNEDYLAFVKAHPEWRRSRIKRLFADTHYLEDWSSDISFKELGSKSPVTRVSWFAAMAYCESYGKTLPTTEQWEFTLFDKGQHQEELKEKILSWYGQPNQRKLPPVGSTGKNSYGIYDLSTLVWEWTQDFNSFLSATDSRSPGGKESNLFCGSGSQMGNLSDYAAFMRYSFRASLKANYTTANLGFRCAKGSTE